eukprot:CAMPEP_0183557906 /NCGR_PEP_ID=MMETSP0371-20130417/86964_1 /TAXON_ID=268820 /ORGANISM="Peridinium aciculiferum, Strain PAER-2" /LENGTH=62 /DNA_ID=CAMNT_0025765089 /DNA_START=39 /DNA_END=227 /DNA_ORIENTATION=+
MRPQAGTEPKAGIVPHRLNAGTLVRMRPQWNLKANGACVERKAAIVPHRLNAVMFVGMSVQW